MTAPGFISGTICLGLVTAVSLVLGSNDLTSPPMSDPVTAPVNRAAKPSMGRAGTAVVGGKDGALVVKLAHISNSAANDASRVQDASVRVPVTVRKVDSLPPKKVQPPNGKKTASTRTLIASSTVAGHLLGTGTSLRVTEWMVGSSVPRARRVPHRDRDSTPTSVPVANRRADVLLKGKRRETGKKKASMSVSVPVANRRVHSLPPRKHRASVRKEKGSLRTSRFSATGVHNVLDTGSSVPVSLRRVQTVGTKQQIAAARGAQRAAMRQLKRKRSKLRSERKVAGRPNATDAQKQRVKRLEKTVRAAAVKNAQALKRLRALRELALPRAPTVGTKREIENARRALRRATAVLRARHRQSMAYEKRSRKPFAPKDSKRAAVQARAVAQAAAAARNRARQRLLALLAPRASPEPSPASALSATPPPAQRPPARPRPVGPARRISGARLPRTCYCAVRAAKETTCYDFTDKKKSACEARTCQPSYVCVGRRKSKGNTCFLRRVRWKIVQTGDYTCERRLANSYMYVPYQK